MKEKFMKLALEIAEKGAGRVNPNPLVGAIIVKDGRVISSGYHKAYGNHHAEVDAFNNLRESCKGADMYVTLEPCSHYGKTPPCADKIIEMKISNVYVGAIDPNPLVAGNGIRKMKEAGINVELGILEDECIKQQEVFRKYITGEKPFILYKSAMSIDGKIATKYGESKWISSEQSRVRVQKLRNFFMAIMVGVETVINDNPKLTCRLEGGRNPIRIIVDSKLRIPKDANVINDEFKESTIIATTDICDKTYKKVLIEKGVKIIEIKNKKGRVDLDRLVIELRKLGIDGILLEGGSTLAYSAINEGIVDKIQFYIAPKIIGGDAKTAVDGTGIESLENAFKIENIKVDKCDVDIVLEGYLKKRC
ncbi:MAG: bifunctional diaminohydroxyphosphoribosylaminopyrimidine deaminase/5-amino-6-(5-phosphoribosylamino)uracil reductase RibD [Sarcina sp.]